MSIYRDMHSGKLDNKLYEAVTSDGFGFYQISPKRGIRDATGQLLSNAKDGHWKFHFTVDPGHVEAAWDIVYKILDESKYAHRAKVVKPDTARSFANPSSIQAGKMITLYTYDEIKPEVYKDIVGQIERAFTKAKIKPGPASNADRIIPGGRYSSYRAESGPDGEYVASTDLKDLPREQRHNPWGMKDPFASTRLQTQAKLEEQRKAQQRAKVETKKQAYQGAKTALKDIKIMRPPTNYTKGRLFIVPGSNASKQHIQKALAEIGVTNRMHQKPNGRVAFEFKESDLAQIRRTQGMKQRMPRQKKRRKAPILSSMIAGLSKMLKNTVRTLSAPLQNIALQAQRSKAKSQNKAALKQRHHPAQKQRAQNVNGTNGIPRYKPKAKPTGFKAPEQLMHLYNGLASNPPKIQLPNLPQRDHRGQRRGGFTFGRNAVTA